MNTRLRVTTRLRRTAAIFVLACLPLMGSAETPPDSARGATVATFPDRQAFYGDLHLHTSYSLDSYLGFGTRLGPEDAYRFAQGEAVDFQGEPVRRSEPLDFLAVTDHAEWIGLMNELENPDSALSRTSMGKKLRSGDTRNAWSEIGDWPTHPRAPADVPIKAATQSTWQRVIQAANRHYQPGRFTAFIGYEWTVNFAKEGEHYHLHRNVIFRGDTAPFPFSSIDSDKPEDLWAYLENARKQGYEALAIPHNPNLSNGLVFDWVGSEGRPIDQAYAEMRAANEPLIEIIQHKGSSEVHPALSPNDEFADFELFKSGQLEGSYYRDGLGRGLVLQRQAGGVNPFKYGVVGGSDFHTAMSESAENEFAGFAGWWGPFRSGTDLERPLGFLVEGSDRKKSEDFVKSMYSMGSAGLTGVWAESNTRESIYAAIRRKETFATSGTRLKFRFFGGWDFDRISVGQADWVKRAYRQGVSMGSDLPVSRSAKAAPQFLLWALKDPNGANLDRLQVVKVWLRKGKHHDKVYDVALSNGRTLDPKTGLAPSVGNTVNADKATYSNTIGSNELSALWRDPDFDSSEAAVYYLRVIEIPTPRWSAVVAARFGRPRPDSVPATLQERGWSSPIWYAPSKTAMRAEGFVLQSNPRPR